MWRETAVVATDFAIGNIPFGHLEEGTPRWRDLLEFLIVLGLTIAVSALVGGEVLRPARLEVSSGPLSRQGFGPFRLGRRLS